MNDFTSGWDYENESRDMNELLKYQEVCGKTFYHRFANVKDRIYEEAERYTRWDTVNPITQYKINQNKTNACFPFYAKVWTAEFGVKEIGSLNGQSFTVLSWSPRLGRYAAKKAYAYPSVEKMIVRVHTDKGVFDLSSDHKVMLNGKIGSLVKAGDVKEGMSLRSMSIRICNRRGSRGSGRYAIPAINCGKNQRCGLDIIGRLVSHDILASNPKGMVVHHRDENPFNNAAGNLSVLTISEHSKIHNKTIHPNRMAIFQTEKYRQKMSGITKGRKLSAESVAKRTIGFADWVKKNPDKMKEKSKRQHNRLASLARERWLNRAYDVINQGHNINTPDEFACALTSCGIVPSAKQAGRSMITNLINRCFDGYDDFVKTVNQSNHRVLKVEFIGAMMTYAIGVDDPEPDDGRNNTEHNFLLADNDAEGYCCNGIVVKNCTSYGTGRTIENTLDFMLQKGKEVSPFRACYPWIYAITQIKVNGRASKGGATMASAMRGINEYGVLPLDVIEKDFPSAFKDGVYIDGALPWNANASEFEKIYERYADLAEKLQVVTTKPETFDDLVACLKAGYAVAYGTCIKTVLRNGQYQEAGTTSHCMCYGGFDHESRSTYNFNSWMDGKGRQSLDLVKRQWNARYFDCFTVLDVEREGRQGKANWSLK